MATEVVRQAMDASPPGGLAKDADPRGISGLDMGPTIAWYTQNFDQLLSRLPKPSEKPSPFGSQNMFYTNLSINRVNAIVELFPEAALARSRLKTGVITGEPTLYFAKDATPEKLTTTNDVEDALSPTALIPGVTSMDRWDWLSSDIRLPQIPRNINPAVREIIHVQALTHEFAHTFITQLWIPGYKLKLPDGALVNGFDFMVEFARATEEHPPISHYSSFYRKDGEEFKTRPAIEEELAEVIAARLLGFAYSDDTTRAFEPLQDRPEVVEIVDQFLNAREMNLFKQLGNPDENQVSTFYSVYDSRGRALGKLTRGEVEPVFLTELLNITPGIFPGNFGQEISPEKDMTPARTDFCQRSGLTPQQVATAISVANMFAENIPLWNRKSKVRKFNHKKRTR